MSDGTPLTIDSLDLKAAEAISAIVRVTGIVVSDEERFLAETAWIAGVTVGLKRAADAFGMPE